MANKGGADSKGKAWKYTTHERVILFSFSPSADKMFTLKYRTMMNREDCSSLAMFMKWRVVSPGLFACELSRCGRLY